MKGKTRRQEAFRLLKPAGVKTRIEAAAVRGLTRFVGRRREIENLVEAFETAASGSGQIVGVVGEAGAGKSRILLEFKKRIADADYGYLEGRCLHYGGNMPYLPVIDILKSYLEIEEDDGEPAARKKLEDKLLGLDQSLRGALLPLRQVLSMKIEDEKYLQLTTEQKKMRIFEAVRDVFFRESLLRPLVVAFEDLHWIDKSSEEFLNYLIDSMGSARILLVLLYRPEYVHPWGGKSYYSKIGVNQLSEQTSDEMVQAILGGEQASADLKRLIFDRSGGNPFFAEELTHCLLEQGSVQKSGGMYILNGAPSSIHAPETIQGIIAARIDRVEENLKSIMQAAAVVGREFAFRILREIMEMKEGLKSRLLQLQGLEFISERRMFPELEYIFKHAFTQEVAYDSLLLQKRKQIHKKIGNAIESLYPDRLEEYFELLAFHYGRAGCAEKALEYLELANRKAADAGAMLEAKAHFDEAMKLMDAVPDTVENSRRRIRMLNSQGFVMFHLLNFREYYDLLTYYEHLAINLNDVSVLGAYYSRMGHCEWAFGYFSEAVDTLEKSIGLCLESNNFQDLLYAYWVLQWAHIGTGNFEKSLGIKNKIIPMMGERLSLLLYVMTRAGGVFANMFLGRWEEGAKDGMAALKAAEDFSDNSLIAISAAFLSYLYGRKQDRVKAFKYASLSVDKSETPADNLFSETAMARFWVYFGKPSEGMKFLSRMKGGDPKKNFIINILAHQMILGDVFLRTSEFEKAEETIHGGLKVAEKCGAIHFVGFFWRLLGEFAMNTGRKGAETHFEKSISVFRKIKAENELAMAHAGYGRLKRQQGDLSKAREYLSLALEIFDRLGTLIEPDKIRKELAELLEDE